MTPSTASSPSLVVLGLPPDLLAGPNTVLVLQPVQLGSPPQNRPGFGSNAALFTLLPVIQKDPGAAYLIQLQNVQDAGNNTRSADVTITIGPHVGKRQRVTLLLVQTNLASATDTPQSYSFEADPRDADVAPTSQTVTFHATTVGVGTYLTQVQVDGAQSPLDLDSNSKYSAPLVTFA